MERRVYPKVTCTLPLSVHLRGEVPWRSFSRAQASLPVPGTVGTPPCVAPGLQERASC